MENFNRIFLTEFIGSTKDTNETMIAQEKAPEMSKVLFCFVLLATPCSLWNLSSPTRDRTRALDSESPES